MNCSVLLSEVADSSGGGTTLRVSATAGGEKENFAINWFFGAGEEGDQRRKKSATRIRWNIGAEKCG